MQTSRIRRFVRGRQESYPGCYWSYLEAAGGRWWSWGTVSSAHDLQSHPGSNFPNRPTIAPEIGSLARIGLLLAPDLVCLITALQHYHCTVLWTIPSEMIYFDHNVETILFLSDDATEKNTRCPSTRCFLWFRQV